MSPNIGDFDSSEVEPRQSFDPLPYGWYAMQVIGSEIRESKSSDGQYLVLDLEILEDHHPDLKGRRAWDRINLWNQNPQAVEIAQRTLSAVCRAVGVGRTSDSEDLHHKPLAVKLKVRPADGRYDATNEVADYDSLEARMGKGRASAPPASSPPQAGRRTAPWER